MNLLMKEINTMKNKFQHMNDIKYKIKGDLTLLGDEVKEVTNEDNEQQQFEQGQRMTSTQHTVRMEEQKVVKGLLNINA